MPILGAVLLCIRHSVNLHFIGVKTDVFKNAENIPKLLPWLDPSMYKKDSTSMLFCVVFTDPTNFGETK